MKPFTLEQLAESRIRFRLVMIGQLTEQIEWMKSQNALDKEFLDGDESQTRH